jgi:hypothetical protein
MHLCGKFWVAFKSEILNLERVFETEEAKVCKPSELLRIKHNNSEDEDGDDDYENSPETDKYVDMFLHYSFLTLKIMKSLLFL